MAPVSIMCLNPSLFSSPPPNPRINDPSSSNAPPPLPVPIREHNPKKFKQPLHSRTHYHKPLPPKPAVIAADGDRSVVVGESGISYLLPNAPFEYQFSYSETPKAKPLAIREPAFLPFGPQTMNRPWTGKAKLVSKKEKERKKKIRLFDPDSFVNDNKVEEEDEEEEDVMAKRVVVDKKGGEMGKWSVGGDGRSREEVLGERLKRWEIRQLVKPLLSTNRQLNLGRDGLTHNMLEMIHAHWKRQQVCKVRCRGVPTVDMDNVCYHLEEKSGGKIIHRIGGVLYLFRGRNYNPRTRPQYPLMLWKPAAPVYPKLIQDVPEGLSESEAEELRIKGKKLLPICKLAKNGIYLNLVKDVRDAFEECLLVKVNCEGLHASDYKKIGAKLMELVPCVLLSFDDEQILMWRGKDWKPRYRAPPKLDLKGENESIAKQDVTPSRMFLLWKRAIDMNKALLLDDDIELSPDSLLEKVEEFQSLTQADEHTYPAAIVTSNRSNVRDDEFDDISEDFEEFGIDISDVEDDDSSVPYGSLPVDKLAERLGVD